jgi:hypothetical protein
MNTCLMIQMMMVTVMMLMIMVKMGHNQSELW